MSSKFKSDTFDDIIFTYKKKQVLGDLTFVPSSIVWTSKGAKKEKERISIDYVKYAVYSHFKETYNLALYYENGEFSQFSGFGENGYERLKRAFSKEVRIENFLTYASNSYKDQKWSNICVDGDKAHIYYEGYHTEMDVETNKDNSPDGCVISLRPNNEVVLKIKFGNCLAEMTNLTDLEGYKRQIELYKKHMVVRYMDHTHEYVILSHSETNIVSLIPIEPCLLLYHGNTGYQYAKMLWMESLSFNIKDAVLTFRKDLPSLRDVPQNDVVKQFNDVYQRITNHKINGCLLEGIFKEVDKSEKKQGPVGIYPLDEGLLIRWKGDHIFHYQAVDLKTSGGKVILDVHTTGIRFEFHSLKEEAYEHAKLMEKLCEGKKLTQDVVRIYDIAYRNAKSIKAKEDEERIQRSQAKKENSGLRSFLRRSDKSKSKQTVKRSREGFSLSEDSEHKVAKKDSQGIRSPAEKSVSCMDVRTTSKGEPSNPLKQRSDSASILTSSSVGGVGNVQLPSSARIDIAAQSLPSAGGDDRTLPSSPKKSFGQALKLGASSLGNIARKALRVRKSPPPVLKSDGKSQPSPSAGGDVKTLPSSPMSGFIKAVSSKYGKIKRGLTSISIGGGGGALHSTPTGEDRTALHSTPTGEDRTALHPTPTGEDRTALHPTPTRGRRNSSSSCSSTRSTP